MTAGGAGGQIGAAMGGARALAAGLTLLLALLPALPGAAEDERLGDRRAEELRAAIYDWSLVENCGLGVYEVYDGYRRRLSHLQVRDGVGKATLSRLRIAAWMAFDREYLDRGLGGQRHWCRTEGVEAARGFLAFRTARMAAQARQRH